MLEMTNENFARLLRGLTIAVGNRRNRILFYQFLAAEIRALHCSYGVGDDESYKRALTFLENCERYTLRSLVRRSAKHHAEVTVDHAKRVFSRALKKLDTSQGRNPTLRAMIMYLLKQEPVDKGIICDPAAAPRGLRIKRIEKSPPRWPATRSAVTWIERANSDISR